MITFILIIGLLAIAHFVYECLILPSIRLHLRLRLFEFRDNLRSLKYEKGDELDDDVFRYLQDAINTGVRVLSRIDIRMVQAMKESFERNPDLLKRMEERTKKIAECPIEELHQIQEKVNLTVSYALLANNGFLLLFLFPIALIAYMLTNLKNRIKSSLNNLFSIPEEEIESILEPMGLSST